MTPTPSPMLQQSDKPLPHPPSTQRAMRKVQTVQEARAKIATLTSEVEELREVRKGVETRIEGLAVEVAQLKSAREKDEARINDLMNEGVRLRLKYEDVREQLRAVLPPDVMELMVEMNEVADRNEVLSVRNSELEREVEKMKAEVGKLEREREKNWTAFAAAGVQLPESSSDESEDDGGRNLGDAKLSKVKKIEVKRSCEGGVM